MSQLDEAVLVLVCAEDGGRSCLKKSFALRGGMLKKKVKF